MFPEITKIQAWYLKLLKIQLPKFNLAKEI